MCNCKNKGCGCRTVITKQGVQGIQGPVGPPGRAGVNGTNGADGAQGPQGEQGKQGPGGERGPQGEQGLPGADGSAFAFDVVSGEVVTLTGVAAAGSSVISSTLRCMKNGKYNTLNYFITLSVSGNIGDTLGLEIDITTYLANNIVTNFYNVSSFDIPAVYADPQITRSVAVSAQKKIVVNPYKLPTLHADQTVYVFGQISFYEL